MPAPGEKIKFKNYHKQMQVPFVIYADFESIIKPYQAAAGDKSEFKSKHQACGFGYQKAKPKPLHMSEKNEKDFQFATQ